MWRRVIGAVAITIALSVMFAGVAHAQYVDDTVVEVSDVELADIQALPRTGSDSFDYVRVGIALAVVGGFLVLMSRKRNVAVREVN